MAANYQFNMYDELVAYCISDVKLLKADCLKFQEEFAQHGQFNPMEKCVTIASACHRYWRKIHLPENTIGVEPPRGWHGSHNNQSLKALKWLMWQEHQLRQLSPSTEATADRIAHAGNEGERKIHTPARTMYVDGYDRTTGTVYEFHGCLWHGCPRCFHKRSSKSRPNPDRTMEEMYEATCAKSNLLRTMGYMVIEKWECDFDKESTANTALADFLSTLEMVDPLNPRDAFFGGRTGAAKLYHKVDETKGEQIRYVDVTSLYPFINKYGTYPLATQKL